MNNYKQIATIFIRVSGLTFMLSGILDLAITVAGILLISLDIVPKDSTVSEIYYVQSFFFLTGGFILYIRSKSIAKSIVSGLQNDEDVLSKD